MSEDLTVEQVLHLTCYQMGPCQINGLSEILTVEKVLNSVLEYLYWLSCQDLQLYESSYTVSTELIAE